MRTLRPGDSDPVIVALKRRLGVFPLDDVFDARLAMRVRGCQNVFGLPITGELDAATVEKIGVGDIVSAAAPF